MRKRLLIFFVLLVLGIIIFKDTLFTQRQIVLSYDNSNITQYSDYNFDGNAFMCTSSDSNIILSIPSYEIDGLQILFAAPISNDMEVRLSYSTNNSETKEVTTKSVLRKGVTETVLPVNNIADSEIILQIGTIAGESFQLQNINIFQYGIDYFQRDVTYFVKFTLLIVFCGMLSLIIGSIIERKQLVSNVQNTKPSMRDSNIELLRILCMLMIIAHHCVVHGGSFSMEYCTNKFVAMILLPGGKIGFTCFLAISTWFLADARFKTSRFIKMWLEVFVFSVLFAGISLFLTNTFTIRAFLGSFLPITGNSHGFASSYLLLYLLIPFLHRITKNLSKFQARLLLAIVFYAQVISQIIGYINNYYQSIYSEILLFILFYIISLNIKRWPIPFIKDKIICGLTFGCVWLTVVQIQYLDAKGASDEIIRFISGITRDESSILYIIGGYALFFLFKGIQIQKNKYINKIASVTFGILLIHDHNYFRTILWQDIFKCSQWYYSPYYILLVLGCVLLIFIVCGCIDYLRYYYIETPLLKSKGLIDFCKGMDKKINE